MDSMESHVILSGKKDDQVRSYVEHDLRRVIDEYSTERGMTASQGMRKLIIEGLRKEGFEIAIAA